MYILHEGGNTMKDGLQENLDDLSSLEQFLHTLTPFQQRILAPVSYTHLHGPDGPL